MDIFQTIALLLTFAAFGSYVNLRFLKLPATIGLMVISLLVSLSAIALNRFGMVNLNAASDFVSHIDFSNILMHGMLSFLLFAGAMHVDISELRKHRAIVATLATVGVVIATGITGCLIWYAAHMLGIDLPLLHALLFGSLISPTDPVAVLGILKQIGMSKNLRVKIGYESLLNDGVAVVIFLVLLGAIETPSLEAFDPGSVALLLAWEGLGSIVLGLSLGWLTYWLMRPIDDYKTEVMLTLALVAGGYCLAETIHVSAPIAMVTAGILIGNHGRIFGMSAHTRQHVDMFWELLDEIMNAILFMLVGLEMMVISFTRLDLAMGGMAIAAVLIGRFISVSVPVSIMRINYRFEKGTVTLLTWGGLRGGISLAMALALPAGIHKELILNMTYIVVVFSVLFQGTTFRHVARLIVNKKPE